MATQYFDSYKIHYMSGYEPQAMIDVYKGEQPVGTIGFFEEPVNYHYYNEVSSGGYIVLCYPISRFNDVINILKTGKNLCLVIPLGDTHPPGEIVIDREPTGTGHPVDVSSKEQISGTVSNNLVVPGYSPSKRLVKFMQRYISDPNFKTEMENNPTIALKNSGLGISEGEIALLSKISVDELHKSLSNIPNITRLDTASAAVTSLNFLSNEEFQPSPGARKFMELYVSDPNFRNSFRSNPSQAVNTYNVQIKCDEVKQLAQIPAEKLEKEFSNIPNITRQNIIMAISEGIKSKTAIEGWPSEDMQQYIKRYVSDPSFRNAVSRNPESALKETGFQIGSEEATYLSSLNLEELEKSVPGTTRMDLPVTYDAVGMLNDYLNESNKEKETAAQLAAYMAALANRSSTSSSQRAGLNITSASSPPQVIPEVGRIDDLAVPGGSGSTAAAPVGTGSGGAAVPGFANLLGLLQKADTGVSPIKTIYFGNPDKTWLLVATNMIPGGGT